MNTLVTTEYEVREIDIHGDAQDVVHFDTLSEASQYARALECVACVVEKHVKRFPAHLFGEPDTYITLEWHGDQNALREGGWIKP